MHSVAVIVGSLRKESLNRKLAFALQKSASDLFEFKMVEIGDFPLFNEDLEASLPAPVVALKETVKAADGVLFVSPEYNRSIPGVLKNAVDWGSRPHGQNVWADKPTALAGMSPGAVGTAVAQSHMRSVFTMLGMRLLSRPEVYLSYKPGMFAEDGSFADAGTAKFLRGFLTGFADWIGKK